MQLSPSEARTVEEEKAQSRQAVGEQRTQLDPKRVEQLMHDHELFDEFDDFAMAQTQLGHR